MATACVKNEQDLPIRLMFQDEARFGRISDPRACWAPSPIRPMIDRAFIREYKYQYATVSPWDGKLDHMTADKMNTENMNRFLDQIHQTYKSDFIVMITDGASSHKSKDLKVPKNMTLVMLPPYSPELNPVEQIWNRLRKNYFYNKVFDSLEAAMNQSKLGLSNMAADCDAIKRLTNWSWINSAILNAI